MVNKMKLTESHLRSIVREEINRLHESIPDTKNRKATMIEDLAKRAANAIAEKYTGKIYNTPSGEIENELLSYLESVGLTGLDLYDAMEQAQERLERIFKISF